MRTFLLASLLALAAPFTAAASESARARGYAVELVDGAGRQLPTFEHDGRTYVLGEKGQRYQLRIANHTGRRIEAVAAVDGRDVLDGRPSDWGRRGYLVPAYGEVVIDGFRLNDDSVAAFRFASVSHSYAALMGDARDVGVIGIAVFPERRPPPPVVRAAPPHPWYGFWGGRSATDSAGERTPLGGAPAGKGLGDFGPAASAEAAPAPEAAPTARAHLSPAKKAERSGLGTEFGEQRDSYVTEVPFERESSRPAVVLSLRYDDRQGLLAMGVDLGDSVQTEVGLRETADPFRRNEYSQPPPGWNCGR